MAQPVGLSKDCSCCQIAPLKINPENCVSITFRIQLDNHFLFLVQFRYGKY